MKSNRLARLCLRCCVLGVAGTAFVERDALAASGTWRTNANGIWSNASNWTGGVPNGRKDTATFGNIITANRVVTVDGTFTVSQIVINDNNSYTLAGTAPNQLRLEANGNKHATIEIGSLTGTSSHVISAPMALISDLDVSNAANTSLNLTGIISGGRALSLSGRMQLGGANTYTGETLISGANTIVTISNTRGLGSETAGTTVAGGAVVTLSALGSEPLTITSGGYVAVSTSVSPTVYSAPLTLGGGGQIRFEKSMTLNSAVNLSGGDGKISGTATLASPWTCTGTGTLLLGGTMQVNAPIAHAGGVTIDGSSTTTFNAINSFPGPLTLRGTLNVNANQSVSKLVLAGGSYTLQAGKTLDVRDSIGMTEWGTVNITRTGATPVFRYGRSTTTLAGLGDSYFGVVDVQEGALVVAANNALGSTLGNTKVSASTGAVLRINNGLTVNEVIYLNNASGLAWDGALTGNATGSVTTPALLTGPVFLGDKGSYVGGGPSTGYLTLAGPISGGSLTKVGNLLRITGNQNTYTGQTRVREATMDLVDNGRLTKTSDVLIERYGELNLDNQKTAALGDRLADGIPIAMRGGVLRMFGAPNSVITHETVGPVSLEYGASKLVVNPVTPNVWDTTWLTLTSLTRLPGATVDVSGSSLGSYGKLLFTTVPPVTNGILPPWLTVDGRFSTYDSSKGVVQIPIPAVADPNSHPPTDNVYITNQVVNTYGDPILTADRTMNSLSLLTSRPLDLGGHVLTLGSGGLLAEYQSAKIRNGTLRAGEGSGGELVIHTAWDLEISANITGDTRLTKSNKNSGLTLSGINTYTGPTVVNESAISIANALSVPADNDVVVNGGTYQLLYTSTTPLQLRSLTLRGDGTVASTNPSPPIDAQSYEVEQGRLYARLSGNGRMRKTTDGELVLRDNNSAYSGTITIEGGTITLGDMYGWSPYSLGTGTTIVKKGGRLRVYYGTVIARIVMAGGEVVGLGKEFSDDVSVIGDSDLLTGDAGSSQVLQTTISGDLDVAAGARLKKSEDHGTVLVTGDAHIDGTLDASEGISVTPGSGKKVSGAGSVKGKLDVGAGGSVAPGNSPGTLSVTSGAWGSGGTYLWELARAGGVAGVDWDLLHIDEQLLLTATAAAPFTIRLSSLNAELAPGLVADFNAGQSYLWPIASAGNLVGFSPDAVSIDSSGFANNLQGGSFSVVATGTQLAVQFTAVPEPGCGMIVLLSAAALRLRRREL